MPVWQNALHLFVRVYSITKKFPKEEIYGMTADMRRSANSVLHNLAEGSEKKAWSMEHGSCFDTSTNFYSMHFDQERVLASW